MENNGNSKMTGLDNQIKELKEAGIFTTTTANDEDVMIYHFPKTGTRVNIFREDKSVEELVYDKDGNIMTMAIVGTWEIDERSPEEEK